MTYTEIATGNVVEVVRCEHGGIVMEIMHLGEKARFEEGDFIVTGTEKKVVKEKDFDKQYRPIGAKLGTDWAAKGWKV